MSVKPPHFLLFSESRSTDAAQPAAERASVGGSRGPADSPPDGAWHFVLKTRDGRTYLEAADGEPEASGERLNLLALVRGLEALDQPSRVTVITSSPYVRRGLRFGLTAWRDNGWQWERYGTLAPIKNRDLWQRVDRALRYHDVECRLWRRDAAHDDLQETRPRAIASPRATRSAVPAPMGFGHRRQTTPAGRRWRSRLAAWLGTLWGRGWRRPEMVMASH